MTDPIRRPRQLSFGLKPLRLEISPSGPGVYALRCPGRPPEAADVDTALRPALSAARVRTIMLAGGLRGLVTTRTAGGPV